MFAYWKNFKSIAFIQIAIAVLMVIFWWILIGEMKVIRSAILGGGTAIIPSWVFASILLRAVQKPKWLVWRLCLGEGIKWMLTVMLFLVCIVLLDVEMLPFLVSFVVVQMSLGFGLLVKIGY